MVRDELNDTMTSPTARPFVVLANNLWGERIIDETLRLSMTRGIMTKSTLIMHGL
jgi:hypothetical protein